MSNNESTEPKFIVPQREIKTLMSLNKWNRSEAYRDLLGFILTINEVVKGKTLTHACHRSDAVKNVEQLLLTLDEWVDQIPPLEQPQRFGNKAFRDWHKKLTEHSDDLIMLLLPEHLKDAHIELKVYLHDSFGNSTRIDYGTGHEACFLLFLCGLYKLRVLTPDDNLAIANIIFKQYLELARKLQTTYRMEPAGSQGVWGLDDFQFIPFLWGSSQLISHPTILPEHLPKQEYATKYSQDYMLFRCIEYINTVKTGPFAEHSNVLWGISSVPHWTKVNSGLLKMYKVEVLSKFPVVQHFLFGNLLSIKEAK